MANPLKGEVSLDIGGTSYTLKLSYNALCEAEALLGSNAPEIIQDMGQGSWVATRAIFFAALHSAIPSLTVEQAGEFIQSVGMKTVMMKITEAFTAAFGEKEAEGENPT